MTVFSLPDRLRARSADRAGGMMFDTAAQSWNEKIDWRTGQPVPADTSAARPAWRRPAAPGVLPKRPLRFFEGLDGGFRLLRARPGATFGISLIVNSLWTLALAALLIGLLVLIVGFLTALSGDADATAGFSLIAQFGVVAQSFLTLSLIQIIAGFAAPAALAAFSGQPATLRHVWARLRGVRMRLFGAAALLFAAHLLALLVCAGPSLLCAALGASVASLLFMVAGFCLWFAFTLYFGVRTAFTGAAIACERLGVRAAIARSWRLTGRPFWRTCGQLLLGYWLSGQILQIVVTPIMLILYIALIVMVVVAAGSPGANELATNALVALSAAFLALTIAANGVLLAYWASLASVLYVDQRMRREGYDLVLLRAAEAGPAEESAQNAREGTVQPFDPLPVPPEARS